jgi:hypothetical protein
MLELHLPKFAAASASVAVVNEPLSFSLNYIPSAKFIAANKSRQVNRLCRGSLFCFHDLFRAFRCLR